MRVKLHLVAVTGVAVAAFTGPVSAETIGFPKDKPAITLELPAGSTAKFAEDGSLWVMLKGKRSYAQLSEIDSCPSDKEATERVTKEASDSLSGVGYETGNRYVSEKEKLTDGILTLRASVGGMFAGHERSAPEVFTEAAVLWVKEKRCFFLSSVHDMAGMRDYLALRKTLKPAP